MTGSLRDAWPYLVDDVWEPLGAFSDEGREAPLDLWGALFVAADEFLAPRPMRTELEEARNDPEAARSRFMSLTATDFASESSIVHFLEEAFSVIEDYEMAKFTALYKQRIEATMRKFNLRYRLDEPFTLRFLLPGSFSNLYGELHRVNAQSTHLSGLLGDFEKAFDRYARTEDETDLKTCIAKASNYAEGVASHTHGSHGTLGRLCDQLRDWPHEKVKESLKSMYGFCSDYPGIRHAGNPNGVHRPLHTRDVALACLLLLSFSGYLSPLLDERAVLGV